MMQESQFIEQFSQQDSEEKIDVREYLNVVLKRKKIILTVLVIIFLISSIRTYSEIPVYTASCQVLIERNRASRSLENQYVYYEPNFLSTQSAIIKSANVARRVVDNLKLDTRYRHNYFTSNDDSPTFFSSLKGNIKQFLYNLIGIDKKGGNEEEDDIQTGSSTNNRGTLSEKRSDADTIASIVQSGLSIRPVKDTKIVTITYSDKNPVMAKLIANGIVQAYMDEVLEIKLASSNYTLQWMTKKAEEERNKLQRAESGLQKYMRDNDLVTIEDKLAIYPQKLAEFSSQLSKAQTERKELESLVQQINALGRDSRAIESVSVFAESGVLKDLREQIYKSKQNIKDFSKKYGSKHPLLIKAKDELEILLNEKRFEIDRIVASIRSSYNLVKSREKNQQDLQAKAKSDLLDLNEKFIQYSIMKREVDTNRILYDALTSSIKKESVTEQTQSVNIWVVKKAELPGAPSKPNKRRSLMLGLMLGLAAGIGVAFLIEYLDNTIKKERDLEDRFGHTVLGTVDEVLGDDEIETYLVHKPLSPLSESYRLIRSGLLLSSAEHPPKTILITSMGAKEGKTSTTTNLARVLAQNQKKVLIIDCDMRRPRMHTVLDISNDLGLSNYLSGTTHENILHTLSGSEVSFISAGTIPPNPAELLSSEKMRLLLTKLSEVYDHILLDSPPILSVTDSLALSAIVDGTIVVVRAGRTTYEMMESGMKKLRDVNAHVLGFVLNARRKRDVGSSYYYGYGYGKSSYYAKDE